MHTVTPYTGDRWRAAVGAVKAAVREANAAGLPGYIRRAELGLITVSDILAAELEIAPCSILGHDYGPVVYFSPAVLNCCRRCGRDILGRDFDDLEPMTDEERDTLDDLDRYYEQGDA